MQYTRPTCAFTAQSLSAPRIVTGQIIDPAGAVIPDAEVLVRSANKNFSYTHTDRSGCFSITAPLSSSEIHARAQGFQSASQPLPGSTSSDAPAILLCLGLGGGSQVEVTDDPQASFIKYSVCVSDLRGNPVQATLTLPSNLEVWFKPRLTDVWGCAILSTPTPGPILHVTAEGFQDLDSPLPKSTTPYPPLRLTLQRINPRP
jgi:hypothetical protein